MNYAVVHPRPFEWVAPQQGLVLEVALPRIGRAFALRAATDCVVESEGDSHTVRLPELVDYEVIVLEE